MLGITIQPSHIVMTHKACSSGLQHVVHELADPWEPDTIATQLATALTHHPVVMESTTCVVVLAEQFLPMLYLEAPPKLTDGKLYQHMWQQLDHFDLPWNVQDLCFDCRYCFHPDPQQARRVRIAYAHREMIRQLLNALSSHRMQCLGITHETDALMASFHTNSDLTSIQAILLTTKAPQQCVVWQKRRLIDTLQLPLAQKMPNDKEQHKHIRAAHPWINDIMEHTPIVTDMALYQQLSLGAYTQLQSLLDNPKETSHVD